MVLVLFLLYSFGFLTSVGSVIKKMENWQDSMEQVVPLILPKLLTDLGSQITLNKEFRNFTRKNHNYLQTDFVQGYSLRIPKHKMKSINRNNTALEKEIRSKRGVIHLYNMISCATGCNPLSYKGYGCYCGLLGSGVPVDGIDRCCKKHDWCYDAARCPMYLEYFVPYYWKCWYNTPFCAIDHGEFGGRGSCADKLCECDRALSECLKIYRCPSRRAFCKSSPLRLLQNVFMWFT